MPYGARLAGKRSRFHRTPDPVAADTGAVHSEGGSEYAHRAHSPARPARAGSLSAYWSSAQAERAARSSMGLPYLHQAMRVWGHLTASKSP